MTAAAKGKIGLHVWILMSLILGAILGLAAQMIWPVNPDGTVNDAIKSIQVFTTPIGGVFMTMIFMVVVPLLFSALVMGVAELGGAAKIGKIGVLSLLMTVILSGMAVGLGLFAVNAVKPGEGISVEKRTQLISVMKKEAEKKGSTEKAAEVDPPLLGIIPKNPLLEATRALSGGLMPFMFFAMIFGLALTGIDPEKALPVRAFLEGLFEVCLKIIDMAMKLAPIGVFCLVFNSAAILGLDALTTLGKYAILVLVVLAFHQFVVYSFFIKFVAKRNPLEFFRQMKTVMLTAFSTSSSNATLPTALKAAEEDLGLPRRIGNFVLTVGATANQNGTALFEGITILFLCQVFGVNLDFGQQLTVMGLAIVAGIGTAGVPGGAWPMIATILVGFGVPAESIGLVLGIDRLLDMSRTVLNVTGDMTIAACVSALDGQGTAIPAEAME